MDTLEPSAATLNSATPLVPPTVTPPEAPLPMWRFVPTFVRNPLRTLPRTVYRDRFLYRPAANTAWVSAPDLVERLLLTEQASVAKAKLERRIFGASLGNGLLTSEGTSWRWQRKVTAPIFRHDHLLALVPAMVAAAGDLTEQWRAAGGGHRAIDQDMEAVTFDIISRTIFAGAADTEGEAIRRNADILLENAPWRIISGIFNLPTWMWHPGKGAAQRAAAHSRATVAAILERRRARGVEGDDITARLLSARDPETGAPMADSLIIDNLLTFLAAGHETTAKALTWTLYLLARSPEWQERVRAEVVAVAGDRALAADDIERLAITRQVVKEGMRLYPPVPFMGRVLLAPFDADGVTLAAGTHVVIPIFAIHRHEKLWVHPEVFDPTRFTPEQEARQARTQFMPFGFGPRICIGMSFAMIEATLLLATFVRAARFDWDGVHRPEPVSRVTLRPDGGMPLHLGMPESAVAQR